MLWGAPVPALRDCSPTLQRQLDAVGDALAQSWAARSPAAGAILAIHPQVLGALNMVPGVAYMAAGAAKGGERWARQARQQAGKGR